MESDARELELAEMQLKRREVAYLVRQESVLAETNLSRSNARIYDWRAVRFAETLLRYYDERCAQAEAALERRNQKEAVPCDSGAYE